MAGEVLNMSDLTINKHRCKLKDLCSKNRHKTIYLTLGFIVRPKITNRNGNREFNEIVLILSSDKMKL